MFKKYNVNLNDFQIVQFEEYFSMLIETNKVMNLTAIIEEDDEYIYGKNDIFALLIILKELLTADDFKMMMNEICYEIDKLSSKLKVIDVNKVLFRMGFPENYKQLSYLE